MDIQKEERSFSLHFGQEMYAMLLNLNVVVYSFKIKKVRDALKQL